MIALLLAACTIALAAQSQPPTPRTGKSKGNPPQNKATTTQQQPATDQRGTEQSPVVVKVLPTPKTQEEAAQEKDDRDDKASASRWTMWLAGLTVLVGCGQLIVYGIQARRLRETIDKMDAIAKDQTKDMQASIAQSTRAADATRAAADAAVLSANVAKQTLVVAHRAYLHIATIQMTGGRPNPDIVLLVKNSGRLEGTIRGWAAICQHGPLPPIPNVKDLIRYENSGPVMPDGTITLKATTQLDLTATDWHAILQGKTPLNVWGIIWYETGFAGVGGETGFGFEYDSSAPHAGHGERFAVTDAPGYYYTK
jgi:hypothetical protein